jgi:hypothetical protein
MMAWDSIIVGLAWYIPKNQEMLFLSIPRMEIGIVFPLGIRSAYPLQQQSIPYLEANIRKFLDLERKILQKYPQALLIVI